MTISRFGLSLTDLPPETDWYRGDVLPVYVGYYRVRNNPDSKGKRFTHLNCENPRWWDGEQWLCWKNGPVSVMGHYGNNHQWCGLTKEVK